MACVVPRSESVFLRQCLPLSEARHVPVPDDEIPSSTLLLHIARGVLCDYTTGIEFRLSQLQELGIFEADNLDALTMQDFATRIGGSASYHYVEGAFVHVCLYRGELPAS